MNGTIRHIGIVMEEKENCSADLGKRSSCELLQGTLFSSGENSSTGVVKPESTAPCSEMRVPTRAADLFDKRMQLLIASGLICGITPTSIRKQSGAKIPDFASLLPVGERPGKSLQGD
jgi:hypothetical protein